MTANNVAAPDIEQEDLAAATSVLQQRANEIRAQRVNWMSYLKSQMISKEDYNFIMTLEKLIGKSRADFINESRTQCAKTFLNLLGHVSKDQTVQYLLEDQTRVEIFKEFAAKRKESVWSTFLNLFNRTDPFIVNMTARVIAKMACWTNELMEGSDLHFYLTWLKDQLKIANNEYIQSVARCLQMMLRVDEYRFAFVEVDGIAVLISVLQGKLNFQVQYQLAFCIWVLTFNPRLAAAMGKFQVIPTLADILSESVKEKVTRIILAVFRNLVEKTQEDTIRRDHCMAMVQCKVLKHLELLQQRNLEDEELQSDVDFLVDKLTSSVVDLSSFDEYMTEVKSGRLEWSPVHRSERFWLENASRLNDHNYELLKILINLLQTSREPLVLSVANHDIGEYVRHYPRGKHVIEQLGGKHQVMQHLTHADPNVRYEALLAVQKLMVHNWFLQPSYSNDFGPAGRALGVTDLRKNRLTIRDASQLGDVGSIRAIDAMNVKDRELPKRRDGLHTEWFTAAAEAVDLHGALHFVCALGGVFIFFVLVLLTFKPKKSKKFPRFHEENRDVYREECCSRGSKKRALLVIAHPDDECMFFGPTILELTEAGALVYVLCFSTGSYGKNCPKTRRQELLKSCAILKIPPENVIVLNFSNLQDDPKANWSCNTIAALVLRYVETYQCNAVITFDHGGVSNHPNHRALFSGVQLLIFTRLLPSYCRFLSLTTVPTSLKYIPLLEVPFAYFQAQVACLASLSQRYRIQKAMKAHASQMVWFRVLYIMFSRYLFLNTYEIVDEFSSNRAFEKRQASQLRLQGSHSQSRQYACSNGGNQLRKAPSSASEEFTSGGAVAIARNRKAAAAANQPMKTGILDKSLNRGRTDLNVSAYAFLFSEIVQYSQNRSQTVPELQKRLSDLGFHVGSRMLDLVVLRERGGKRDLRILSIMMFLKTSFWKALFGKEADKLERANDDERTYYLIEKEPLVNKFISVPKDKGSLNCAAFSAGIVEAVLCGSGFPCKVTTHWHKGTTFMVKFDEEVLTRDKRIDGR
ncbi:unnamed protein product [Notodromas monacha]|uniref:Trafficking protein particle complex subunit 5 n=1 Tax=Notodromas monacha TaxID=399045 RepID=A0A7R9BR79_9CRUS|nr:unnamed protein product [Notodromas monacha]CAG0920174.1 unnamed protein product [Notodromas monacha]